MPRHKTVMAFKPNMQHNVDHISLPLSAAAVKNTWLSSMHLAALTPFKYDFLCNRPTHLQCANRCEWQRELAFARKKGIFNAESAGLSGLRQWSIDAASGTPRWLSNSQCHLSWEPPTMMRWNRFRRRDRKVRPCGVEGEFYERDENQTPSQVALKMEAHFSWVRLAPNARGLLQ